MINIARDIRGWRLHRLVTLAADSKSQLIYLSLDCILFEVPQIFFAIQYLL